MELAIWRNIKDTSRKIFSPLEHRITRYGFGTIAGVGFALYSLPPIIEGQISPLEVYVKCRDSKPQIEVIGDISVNGAVNWLVVEEVESRRFRVLEKSTGAGSWIFGEAYQSFADPRSKYTEVPVGRFDFRKGRDYDFSIYKGDYSSRKTPLLDKRLHQVRKTIPAC